MCGGRGTDGHGLPGQDEELRRMTGSDALSLDQELAMQVSLLPAWVSPLLFTARLRKSPAWTIRVTRGWR